MSWNTTVPYFQPVFLLEKHAKCDIDINHIFVKEPYRLRGIGTQLMHQLIEKSEETKIPIFIKTEPEAYKFLLRMGFKDTKHVDEDLSKWSEEYTGYGIFRLSGMIRIPGYFFTPSWKYHV